VLSSTLLNLNSFTSLGNSSWGVPCTSAAISPAASAHTTHKSCCQAPQQPQQSI
jgi:hypothetical protein